MNCNNYAARSSDGVGGCLPNSPESMCCKYDGVSIAQMLTVSCDLKPTPATRLSCKGTVEDVESGPMRETNDRRQQKGTDNAGRSGVGRGYMVHF